MEQARQEAAHRRRGVVTIVLELIEIAADATRAGQRRRRRARDRDRAAAVARHAVDHFVQAEADRAPRPRGEGAERLEHERQMRDEPVIALVGDARPQRAELPPRRRVDRVPDEPLEQPEQPRPRAGIESLVVLDRVGHAADEVRNAHLVAERRRKLRNRERERA